MPSGRQICNASASRSQCISSASCAARLCLIARSARSTVRQSGPASGRCSSAHVGASPISPAASSIPSRSMPVSCCCRASLLARDFQRHGCALRDDSWSSSRNRVSWVTRDFARITHASASRSRSTRGSRRRVRAWPAKTQTISCHRIRRSLQRRRVPSHRRLQHPALTAAGFPAPDRSRPRAEGRESHNRPDGQWLGP